MHTHQVYPFYTIPCSLLTISMYSLYMVIQFALQNIYSCCSQTVLCRQDYVGKKLSYGAAMLNWTGVMSRVGLLLSGCFAEQFFCVEETRWALLGVSQKTSLVGVEE